MPALFHVAEAVRLVGVSWLMSMSSQTAGGYLTGDPVLCLWTFVDADDLADLALRAATVDNPEHEVVYAAQPDNLRGEPLADMVVTVYGDDAPPVRQLARRDAGAIDISKARRLFGWDPRTGLAAR